MGSAISDPVQLVADQIKDALDGRGQAWLGRRVAEVEGRDEPYAQPTAGEWIKRPEIQPPSRMFAIEKALDLAPGSLSRLLGYVPAGLAPATSVVDAINADPRLDKSARSVLIDVYRSATKRRGRQGT